MTVGFATLGGGDTVSFDLNSHQISALQALLADVSAGKPDQVLTSFGQTPNDTTTGTFNAYNLDPSGFDPVNYAPPFADAMIADSVDGTTALSTDGPVGTDRLTVWVGNQGNDTLSIDGPGQSIFAGDGNNVITLDSFHHGNGYDLISVGSGSDTITLIGQGTVTALDVSGSADVIHVDGYTPYGDLVQVGDGNDSIYVGQDVADYGIPANATVIAGNGNDLLDVQADLAVITVGTGSDTINFSGAATITAGGNAQINVTSHFGYAATDITLNGTGTSAVSVVGGLTNVTANAGTNTINLGTDNAGVSDGWYGTYDVTVTAGADTVNLGLGSATVSTSGSETSLIHADYNNTSLTATLGGSDTVYLGATYDNINVTGSATIYGGTYAPGGSVPTNAITQTGSGTLVFHGGNNGFDTVTAGSGTASLYASSGTLYAQDVFNAGNASSALLDASAAATGANEYATLMGGTGMTTMLGGGGTTSFVTGSGDATMTGGSGYNYFNAEWNGDSPVFDAGSGTASMTGGTGYNFFYAGSGNDTMNANTSPYNSNTGPYDQNFFYFQSGTSGASTINGYHNYDPSDPTVDYTPHLNFSGYGLTADQIVADSHVSGGNTIIDLGSTTITMTNFTTLQDWMIKTS